MAGHNNMDSGGPMVDMGAVENSDLNAVNLHEADAMKYLESHKMIKFFENLTAALVFERPDDPKAYAREFIKKLLNAKNEPDEAEPPYLSMIPTWNQCLECWTFQRRDTYRCSNTSKQWRT